MSYLSLSRSKVGLSSVVTTSFLILLSIILVGGVAIAVIQSTVKLSPTVSCTQMAFEDSFTLQDVCYDSIKGEVRVRVSRSISSSATYIEFGLSSQGTTKEWICSSYCGECDLVSPGSSREYFLTSESAPTGNPSLTLKVDGCTVESISLEPLVPC